MLSKNILAFTKLIIILITFIHRFNTFHTLIDNTCTFHESGKLFSLIQLNRQQTQNFYQIQVNSTSKIILNFCQPFTPKQCNIQSKKAYSWVVNKDIKNNSTFCQRYSSQQTLTYFEPKYVKLKGQIFLHLNYFESYEWNATRTSIILSCVSYELSLSNLTIVNISDFEIQMKANSQYGCPIFEISSIWQAISDNLIIFGIILTLVGALTLFYGILMTQIIIFFITYAICFIILSLAFSSFLTSIHTSIITIYFLLLFNLSLSTWIAYICSNFGFRFSLFIVAASFGLLIAVIFNIILFNYSIYSDYIAFISVILFPLTCGLMALKVQKEILILSTSFIGSYMIIRPITWIFGGYPDVQDIISSFEHQQQLALSYKFYIYICCMILLSFLGASYQFLKLNKQNNQIEIQSNIILNHIQGPVDRIRQSVENIITRISKKKQQKQQDIYIKLEEFTRTNKKDDQDQIISNPKIKHTSE